MNPLLDIEFLKELYKNHEKEIYAKIVALNTYEEPIEEIQGKVTDGSINVDGNSAVRRTCSLSMVAYDIKLTDYYWGVKTKFNLSIGLKNTINSNYPDIIWFPQGVYIITTFNSSQTTNSFNISLTGKDKMCLLNGEISGSIHANSTRFDIIEEEDGTEKKLLIKDIIKEMVHEHACEPLHNIIINDLEDYGLELLEYRGSSPLYLTFSTGENSLPNNILFNVGDLVSDFKFKTLTTNNGLFDNNKEGDLSIYNDNYYLGKVEFGDAAGYRLTDLTYPGELIANVGESITSVLDKIKNMLNDFEYFYDVNGRFIFQKKKTYINTSWNNLRTGSDGIVYAEAAAYESPIAWTFEGNDTLTSISDNPNLNNLKNDFSIWGTRKSISGAEIPIHLRYAIDKKPTRYQWSDGSRIFETSDDCDYRELIYQMALDYRKNGHSDDYIPNLIKNNPELCARGRTGYEQYYIDMEGFWRQLYDPSKPSTEEYDAKGWNKNIKENPSVLNFWFELLDTEGEISQYSIPAIGDRAKVVNDSSIKSIYFKDTPLIIYYDTVNDRYVKSGYSYMQLSNIDNLFSISTQGKSAKNELDTLLYNHTYCANTISLSSIPIYTLQPNTSIMVKDDENIGINGEYIVSRITIPLVYNGTMSISASKKPERII